MVKCTDQEVNCAPQRLLRREGDVDLKERRGHDINTAPIKLPTQTCTKHAQRSPSHQTYTLRTITISINNVLQTLEEQIYPVVHSVRQEMSVWFTLVLLGPYLSPPPLY